jgi:hypothetical protein
MNRRFRVVITGMIEDCDPTDLPAGKTHAEECEAQVMLNVMGAEFEGLVDGTIKTEVEILDKD